MTPNGRLEEVVEALLKRVEVLEEKAGIRNSNIIKNPKLMVVEDSVEPTDEVAPAEYSPTVENIPTEDEVFTESTDEVSVKYESETSTENIPTKPTVDDTAVEEKSKKNTKKSKK